MKRSMFLFAAILILTVILYRILGVGVLPMGRALAAGAVLGLFVSTNSILDMILGDRP